MNDEIDWENVKAEQDSVLSLTQKDTEQDALHVIVNARKMGRIAQWDVST